MAGIFNISKKALREGLRLIAKEADVAKRLDMRRIFGAYGMEFADKSSMRRQLLHLADNQAYDRLQARDITEVAGFDDFFNAIRASLVDASGNLRPTYAKGLLKKTNAKARALNPTVIAEPTAALLRPGAGSRFTQRYAGAQPFTSDPTASLLDAVLLNDKAAFGQLLTQRINNQLSLVDRLHLEVAQAARDAGLDPSLFYGASSDMDELISNVTGIPKSMVSTAMAVASQSASPYEELFRISQSLPFLRLNKEGVAFLDVDGMAKAGLLTAEGEVDPYAINAGNAFIDMLNGADPLTDKIANLAQKTYTYRNSRFLPGLETPSLAGSNVSVSDRIQQRLAAAAIEGYDQTMGSPLVSTFDYVPNIAVARAEGVSAAVPQEGSWFYQRLIEAYDPKVPNRDMIGMAFPLDSSQVKGVLAGTAPTDVIQALKPEGRRIGAKYKPVAESIDKDVLALARNRDAEFAKITPATPFDVLQYAPESRTVGDKPKFGIIGPEVPHAALAFGEGLGGLLRENRRRRGMTTLPMAAAMTAGGVGVAGLEALRRLLAVDQPPAQRIPTPRRDLYVEPNRQAMYRMMDV